MKKLVNLWFITSGKFEQKGYKCSKLIYLSLEIDLEILRRLHLEIDFMQKSRPKRLDRWRGH